MNFKFWYHLYGISLGTLNIWLRENNQLVKNLWSRSGNFGNYWRYGHVTVQSQTDFQIALEGIFLMLKTLFLCGYSLFNLKASLEDLLKGIISFLITTS